jgi:hypothetical protein
MRTSELLHYAFRARDPLRLGLWYADLFDGRFLIHPVMSGLGIVLVKLNHPEALYDGLLEIWPWDVVWDGRAAVFRRVSPQPSPTSYGHVALKVAADAETIVAELGRRGIAHRMEPREAGRTIPVIDDPEGNMVELFPNVDHAELPPGAFCPPGEVEQVMAALRERLEQRLAALGPRDGVPLLLFEAERPG